MESYLGYLPSIYERELLYSLFARYHTHSLNNSPKQTMVELFNKQNQLAVSDLPINLVSFYRRSKPFIGKEFEKLISEHTFLNFYSNFLDKRRRDFIIEVMKKGDVKGAIHMKSGVMASSIKEKAHFHYCPECVVEDIEKYGETYWHLIPQLPGIYICTKHKIYLLSSKVPFRGEQRHVFIPASLETCPYNEGSVGEDPGLFRKLLKVAEECEYVALSSLNIDTSNLLNIYKNLLIRNGFVRGKGNINQYKLVEQFQNYYGVKLLKILQSEVNYYDPACWLKAITRKHRKSFHPIRHILLVNFLGETVNSIENFDYRPIFPFGKGPYICLNKASNHYDKKMIPKVIVTFLGKNREPYGTFKCECGFHYSRKGPDRRSEDKYKIDRIKQFGDVWIDKVKDLIHNEGISFRAVARRLDVDTKTIIKYSRFTKKLDKVKDNPMNDKKRELTRHEWLMHLKQYPELSITKLRKLKPALYAWLYRHEKKWLLEVSPKQFSREKPNIRVNWEMRDQQIVNEIKEVIHYILGQEPPIRITVSRIGNLVKKRFLLEKHLDKLPHSKEILMDYVEHKDDFQIRRIGYAVRYLKDKGEQIREWRIRRVAGLGKSLSLDVENYIENVINDKKI
ncbi:TnsD family transposase [Metabacillus fastidiosus]|uniref:TnsD family transposase n=1 Tax=Metabacillus fastidiosus TaxID=1458 RepID=UPI002E2420F9|nr:TnsD family transposase [Metabacillus fastidiosus]